MTTAQRTPYDLDIEAACQYLGRSRSWVDGQVRNGDIPHIRMPKRDGRPHGHVRFSRHELDAWMAGHAVVVVEEAS